jgi:hypothetical protein
MAYSKSEAGYHKTILEYLSHQMARKLPQTTKAIAEEPESPAGQRWKSCASLSVIADVDVDPSELSNSASL